MKRKPKTNKELQVLAMDLFKEKVFTNRQILPHDEGLIQIIFMPLTAMTKEQLKDLQDEKPGLFYEYYHKSLDRGINGYPTFTSFHYLTEDETAKLQKFYDKIVLSLAKLK